MVAQMHPATQRETEQNQREIREQEQGGVHRVILRKRPVGTRKALLRAIGSVRFFVRAFS